MNMAGKSANVTLTLPDVSYCNGMSGLWMPSRHQSFPRRIVSLPEFFVGCRIEVPL